MYKIYFALHALIYKLTACIFYIYITYVKKIWNKKYVIKSLTRFCRLAPWF